MLTLWGSLTILRTLMLNLVQRFLYQLIQLYASRIGKFKTDVTRSGLNVRNKKKVLYKFYLLIKIYEQHGKGSSLHFFPSSPFSNENIYLIVCIQFSLILLD